MASDEVTAKQAATTHHPSSTIRHTGTGTVLGFDFGTKRIGVAVGSLETRLAHPLVTLGQTDNSSRFAAIERLLSEWRPAALVVGVPSHADGARHPVAQLARRFGHRLEGRFGIPVRFVDEQLTTHAARAALRAAGTRRDRTRAVLDAVAAQRILQDWLDQLAE